MSEPFFLDTNILVYAALQPDARSDQARALLMRRGLISVQVLNEFVNVASRKLERRWTAIREALTFVKVLCPTVLPLTVDTHERALEIAEHTGYRFFGALIIASALEAGCDTLFSEDLQDGQRIDGRLTIRNPFLAGL
jgi:predicted nucleic acid-binding protein